MKYEISLEYVNFYMKNILIKTVKMKERKQKQMSSSYYSQIRTH